MTGDGEGGAAWFENAPYEAEIQEEYAYLEEQGLLNELDDAPLPPTPPLDSQSTELPNSQYAGYFELDRGRGPCKHMMTWPPNEL